MKPKKCRNPGCCEIFHPVRPMQKVCGVKCAAALAIDKRKKESLKQSRKARLALLDNDRRHWIKKATAACNAYIRERDKSLPCISCGRYHQGQYHAGHYRPAGNNSALRFHELNIHKQCSACNNHKSGNLVDYRIHLIRKIGIDRVDWLEGPHEPKKWTVDELKQIEKEYKQRLKALRESVA